MARQASHKVGQLISLLLSISLLTQPSATWNDATVRGRASYYDATRNNAWYTRGGWDLEYYAAAGPALRKLHPFEWRKPWAVYIYNPKTKRGKTVLVVDWCQCSKGEKSEKLIDLSPKLWQWLCDCDPGLGVQRVRVTVLSLVGANNQ